MFAILVGGGMFGVIGMILGVPTFAVIYYIVKIMIEHKLEKKKLPTETTCYDELSYVTNEGVYVHFRNKENNIQKGAVQKETMQDDAAQENSTQESKGEE